jgi:SpoVK/Ycf46/Vps4 family AAA+-type ATPase
VEEADARARLASGDPAALAGPDELALACRERARFRSAGLAERIAPSAAWEDIVLPLPLQRQLEELRAQAGNRARVYDEWGFARGRGITALFSGPSGTGKTMAAEVLAHILALDLYRIDLAGVVSKFIGETEKNLRRVFESAEHSGAILFFDEADALFGKRTEVRDSHDRYANIEVNYLLQRMESYAGLAILATNRRALLDPAFLRRLRFVLDFPFPAAADRRRMWERAFPASSPVGELDLDTLARLELSGGSIRNVALNAAFLAAADGGHVEMAQVLRAARREYMKLDRMVTEADFGAVPKEPA